MGIFNFYYIMDDIIEDQEHFKAVFNLFARDSDGTISSNDLQTVMRSQGVNPHDDDVKEFLIQSDLDNKGRIEFPEFSIFLGKCKRQSDIEEDLIQAFKVFDADNTGVITNTDLYTILCELGDCKIKDEELEDYRAFIDIDNDGQLD